MEGGGEAEVLAGGARLVVLLDVLRVEVDVVLMVVRVVAEAGGGGVLPEA